jgi:hypothetical protein
MLLLDCHNMISRNPASEQASVAYHLTEIGVVPHMAAPFLLLHGSPMYSECCCLTLSFLKQKGIKPISLFNHPLQAKKCIRPIFTIAQGPIICLDDAVVVKQKDELASEVAGTIPLPISLGPSGVAASLCLFNGANRLKNRLTSI